MAEKLEESRKFMKEQKAIQSDIQANCLKSTEYSRDIVDVIVERKIDELFELLDSDRDGLISAVRINIEDLSKERLGIIAPLLAEMEEKRATFDFDSFSLSIKRLLSILNVQDKRALLNIEGRKRTSINDMLDLPFKVVFV